jgi:hypothetical protein
MADPKLGPLVAKVREGASKMLVSLGGLVVVFALLMCLFAAMPSAGDSAEKIRTGWTLALFTLAVGGGIVWYGVTRGRVLEVYERGASFAGVVLVFDDVQRITENEPVPLHAVAPVGGLLGAGVSALAEDAAKGIHFHGSFVKLSVPRSLVNRAPAVVEGMRQKAQAAIDAR